LLEPGFEVVGVALDGRELSQLAQGTKPDVILLDLGMPNLNGFDTGQQLRKLFPATQIVVVTNGRGLGEISRCPFAQSRIRRVASLIVAAGLRIMGSFSIPTAPTNLLHFAAFVFAFNTNLLFDTN
jgi:CheY-like chemotaxis protein